MSKLVRNLSVSFVLVAGLLVTATKSEAHFHGIRTAMVRPGNSLSTVYLKGRTHRGGVIELSFKPNKGGKFGSRVKGLHDASDLSKCGDPTDWKTCPLLTNTGNTLEVEADVTSVETGAVTHRVFSFPADSVRGSLRLSGKFNLNPGDLLAVREIRLKDPAGHVFAYTGMVIVK